MTSDRLGQCTWPPLAAPFDAALRDAVRFILAEVEPAGIIATGTIVRGQADANSDLDIHVIQAESFRRRVQRLFRGVPTEIFINPPHAIRSYFVEEHRAGRPFTAHMLATGVVVYTSAPIVDELRAEAAEWLQRPTILADSELTRARYALATRVEDAADVTHTDARAATLLLSQAVADMLEFYCKSRLGRVPRSKELLTVAQAQDPEVGRLVSTFVNATTPVDRLRIAESLSDRIIGAHTFFAWDSGPELIPRPEAEGPT